MNEGLCHVVPPHIFQYMIEHADSSAHKELARRALAHAQAMHTEREEQAVRTTMRIDAGMLAGIAVAAPAVVHRKVYTAHNTVSLPGTLVTNDGHPSSADVAVGEADTGARATSDFYQSVFDRSSVDGEGLPLISTVHYGHNYDNAFWDGSQMVYGDGDATLFDRFTKCIDVIGHELTHGVTQYTAHLVYHNQPGALNESMSDVFGSLVRQKVNHETAAAADWLIGKGLFKPIRNPKPGEHRTALRSMTAPGTAYNDPRGIGTDPQPAHMANYLTLSDTQAGDFGGVHINSGIPNKAFSEAAIALGGHSWEKAGKIWYSVLTGGVLSSTATFKEFRDLSVAAAHTLFGSAGEQIVIKAWATVGL